MDRFVYHKLYIEVQNNLSALNYNEWLNEKVNLVENGDSRLS